MYISTIYEFIHKFFFSITNIPYRKQQKRWKNVIFIHENRLSCRKFLAGISFEWAKRIVIKNNDFSLDIS